MPDGPAPDPLAVAALAARSVAARGPLARAAGATSAEAVVAGEAADPWLSGELARVIALQDLRPDDQADALAVLARLRRAGTISGAHQGLHTQLAYAAGDRTLATALLREYREIAEPVRTAVELDLTNPYASGTGWEWAAAFAALLPHPAIRVEEGSADPFDRIVSGAAQRVGHARRIT